jgi:hypothetical protein
MCSSLAPLSLSLSLSPSLAHLVCRPSLAASLQAVAVTQGAGAWLSQTGHPAREISCRSSTGAISGPSFPAFAFEHLDFQLLGRPFWVRIRCLQSTGFLLNLSTLAFASWPGKETLYDLNICSTSRRRGFFIL